jgi:hypothetical protein
LLLVNGGGSVALLTFLPHAWGKSTSILPAVALGLLAMTIGLVFAAAVNFLRYESSRAYDNFAGRERGEQYGWAWRWLAWGSLGMFIIGAGVVACGIWSFTAQISQ